MNTFSFRAECEADVAEFVAACEEAGIALNAMSMSPVAVNFPDVAVEFSAEDGVTVEQLRTAADANLDIRVALETLRSVRLAENSFERTYDSGGRQLSEDEHQWLEGYLVDRPAAQSTRDDHYSLGH